MTINFIRSILGYLKCLIKRVLYLLFNINYIGNGSLVREDDC